MKYLLVLLGLCVSQLAVAQSSINRQNVTIARDAYGVPHVFGITDEEVAYGLAWAHAEDDFGTIQQTLLAGKAMLGRHLGMDGAPIDFIVQWLRARDRVNSHYRTEISEEYQSIVKAYATGINEYAEAHPEEVLVKKAFPVSEEDVMTAYQLSIALFSRLEGTLSALQANEVETVFPSPMGSNGIAFNSNKTEDGQVYLAINSHQPLTGPQAWYEAHLHSEEGWNILGGTFPGGNAIFHGANEYLGWAHTVNHPDKMDVFQLRMHPKKKYTYWFDGEWKELEVRKVPLKVKLGPIVITVKRKALWSVYGPTWEAENGVFALRFPAMFNLRTAESWWRMNKATNFTEWYRILEETGFTHFNIVYGDRNDTIFYISNGRMPYRNPNYDWSGTVPGDTSATLWPEEVQPLSQVPMVLQPSSGYVYNTNNTPFHSSAPEDNPVMPDYDSTMGYGLTDNNRSIRYMELMEEYSGKVSYEDFLRIKYDLQFPSTLHHPVDVDYIMNLDPEKHADMAPLLRKLQNWDRKGTVDNTDAAFFVEVWHYFRKVMNRDNFRVEDHWELALLEAKGNLEEHFGTVDVPFGEYQQLIRGDKALPLPGLPDALAAMYTKQLEDGRAQGTAGESYILLVRFTEEGPLLESVNVYGASNRPDSPHYDDQMELFVEQKTKPMTLDKEAVLAEAVRVYHPGE
ncbi:MAG TPA: peptidase S45 [Cytophagales bacterium]|nr:peptidase S45 [Cytophagales bacterium]HAA18181.1 peptidase S45 [Cytophagales bacterium]HAP59775.1 peptidase S45 [Cytophagales bacterium]